MYSGHGACQSCVGDSMHVHHKYVLPEESVVPVTFPCVTHGLPAPPLYRGWFKKAWVNIRALYTSPNVIFGVIGTGFQNQVPLEVSAEAKTQPSQRPEGERPGSFATVIVFGSGRLHREELQFQAFKDVAKPRWWSISGHSCAHMHIRRMQIGQLAVS